MKWLTVIFKTDVGGVISQGRNAFGEFYRPSRLGYSQEHRLIYTNDKRESCESVLFPGLDDDDDDDDGDDDNDDDDESLFVGVGQKKCILLE